MSAPKPDMVSVLEAIYAPHDDDGEWLRGFIEACEPALDQGRGVFAVKFDLARSEASERGVKLWRAPPVMGPRSATPLAFIDGMNDFVPHQLIAAYRAPYHCQTARGNIRAMAPEVLPMWRAMVAPAGLDDLLGFAATTPAGEGVLVQAPAREEITLGRAAMARWLRVAIHLSAALRLRARRVADAVADADAIFTPDGKCEHATPAAHGRDTLRTLRRAVVDIDHARSRGAGRSGDDALELWRALAAGRWSLVDHFVRGGRRYFLARPNAPSWASPKQLTARERQVALAVSSGASNKVVAYDLGLQVSTIATVLARAMRKLGVRTRGELVTLVRSLRAHDAG